jgi:outer membrane protein OmpA-like peptidoglycan-associated protein
VCAQDTVTVKGIIKGRSGETMIVQTDSGDNTVVIAEDTNTKDDSGFFGLDKEMGPTVLIPGLKVKVDAVPDQQNRLVARTITVDGDDLEASEMIQAGLHPTSEQVAANVQRLQEHQSQLQSHQQKIESDRQDIASNRAGIAVNMKEIEEHERRFASLDDFDVKRQATVKFGVGSTTISNADKDQLKQLAQTATNMSGFLVEVIGFADATGNAAMNTELSENRAKAVVSYLTQQCGVPSRRIVAPGAMGEYGPAASNETRTGRAENRRVEVKVLVNKGITSQ